MIKTVGRNTGKKLIAALLMLSLVVTSGTFAYWASYVEGTSTEATGTLEVGSGDIVQTTFVLSNDLNSSLVIKLYSIPSGVQIAVLFGPASA